MPRLKTELMIHGTVYKNRPEAVTRQSNNMDEIEFDETEIVIGGKLADQMYVQGAAFSQNQMEEFEDMFGSGDKYNSVSEGGMAEVDNRHVGQDIEEGQEEHAIDNLDQAIIDEDSSNRQSEEEIYESSKVEVNFKNLEDIDEIS